MAGIKLLDKKPEHLNYIISELIRPENRTFFLDDMDGWEDVALMLYNPKSIVYGIFEKGRPVPIGTVFITGTTPFRSGIINAIIFDPENRGAGKLRSVVEQVKHDLLYRWHLHSIEARVIGDNAVVAGLLDTLGFIKCGKLPENVMVGGKFCDVNIYTMILNGEKYVFLGGGEYGKE